MHKLLFLFVLLLASGYCNAQDTLRFDRQVVKTDIFINRTRLTNGDLSQIYRLDRTALRKQRVSQVMVPIGAILAGAGFYSAVDGLVGVKKTAQIDGEAVGYVVRSLPKLLIGLALIVTGSSIVQSAGDVKIAASKHYNETIKKQAAANKTAYQPHFGITPGGNIGFRLEF